MDPIVMKSKQFVDGHVDAFVDDQGNPQNVDAARWELSDSTLGTLTQSPDGMDVHFESTDLPLDSPTIMGQLVLHVDEGGVPDAFTVPFDLIVSSRPSPLAVGANISFSAPVDLP